MSFLSKQPALPQTAVAEQQQQSSYREADPIGLFYGREVWGSHWISKDYAWKTATGRGQGSDYNYASIAAAYCIGPIDFVGKVFSDGKIIATSARARPRSPRSRSSWAAGRPSSAATMRSARTPTA